MKLEDQDLKVSVDLQENQDHKELLVSLDLLVHLVPLDPEAREVNQEKEDNKVGKTFILSLQFLHL